ncbi:hypothetical protein [Peribacillus asahii]|uniref:hypothetical protein n=1 Tax=Peribacillus asahii TaxID=228899 RepID=UPI00381FC63A
MKLKKLSFVSLVFLTTFSYIAMGDLNLKETFLVFAEEEDECDPDWSPEDPSDSDFDAPILDMPSGPFYEGNLTDMTIRYSEKYSFEQDDGCGNTKTKSGTDWHDAKITLENADDFKTTGKKNYKVYADGRNGTDTEYMDTYWALPDTVRFQTTDGDDNSISDNARPTILCKHKMGNGVEHDCSARGHDTTSDAKALISEELGKRDADIHTAALNSDVKELLGDAKQLTDPKNAAQQSGRIDIIPIYYIKVSEALSTKTRTSVCIMN